MKSRLLFVLALLSIAAVPTVASPKKSASTMPAEVRALTPKGAKSFLLTRLPIGYEDMPRLIHIWGAVRPNILGALNSYNQFFYSPFCVDIFEPRLNERKQWKWRIVTSATYTDTVGPYQVVNRWLHPAKKQGPILEIMSSNGAPGISTMHTLLVWKSGLREGYTTPTPQTFGSGGSGGGSITQSWNGTDERGYMTIKEANTSAGKTISTTNYRWDGERFVVLDPANVDLAPSAQ